MADTECVALLKRGVETWNFWRKENPTRKVDLSSARLNGANLRSANLSGSDLRGASLRYTFLINANLTEGDLRGANLRNAQLGSARMRGANLRNADLRGADLGDADLRGADLRGVELRGVKLVGADLSGVNLRGFILNRANLSGVRLAGADLRGADLRKASLKQAYMSQINLRQANLAQAELIAVNLVGADLQDTILLGANLQNANLRGALLNKASLVKANLRSVNLNWSKLQQTDLLGADLRQATLCNCDLTRATLFKTNLSGSDLRQANFHKSVCESAQFAEAKLSEATFNKADLTNASLYKVDAIGVDFSRAVLTGACIEDWNINSVTKFKDVVCDYVYLRENSQERRPHGGIFHPGEFTQRFQQFLDTVDLFFVDGVDWKAFLASFQDLQSEYGDENLAIQGIERKGHSSFEVRVAVAPESDKAEIEQIAYERYQINLNRLEAQYREHLAARDGEVRHYQQESEKLTRELLDVYRGQQSVYQGQQEAFAEVTRLLASRPTTIEAKAVIEQNSGKNDLRGAQFAGGYAETVQGNQIGGTINNYGASLSDITCLISTLRDQAQTFPVEHKDDVLMELEDLEGDIQKPQPDQNRIGRRLKRLAAVATTIGAITGGAANFSGDLNDFTSNVIELREMLGIPAE